MKSSLSFIILFCIFLIIFVTCGIYNSTINPIVKTEIIESPKYKVIEIENLKYRKTAKLVILNSENKCEYIYFKHSSDCSGYWKTSIKVGDMIPFYFYKNIRKDGTFEYSAYLKIYSNYFSCY